MVASASPEVRLVELPLSDAGFMTGRGALAEQGTLLQSERFLASGDESGTAPEDRPFRPDVEGLRAVAVLLVVLFHAGVSGLSGGYIGVDVFFVISGFVITGVLLRERASSGRTSILAFYGRRCRRIIPAATLVIIVTVLLSYVYLGAGVGERTATDGRWATVFLANFHFTAVGTDYLGSQLAPSPLQNYWSLAVEEQFYVIYPTIFLLLATVGTRWALRARLAIGLVVILGVSLAFSVIDTQSNATGAYFSPFTRAWELALGALVAVATPWLKLIPSRVGRCCFVARVRCHPRRRLDLQLPDGIPRVARDHSGRRRGADHRRRGNGIPIRG